MGECVVRKMFNQLRMNLRRFMTFSPEIFDEDSLLHGYGYGHGKPAKDLSEMLSSSYFISDEDWLVDFQMALATTQDLYDSIRVQMQTASEMSMRKCVGHHVLLRQNSLLFGDVRTTPERMCACSTCCPLPLVIL
jgi:hypothetical protein